jgi:hypothetical protein
MCDHPWFYHVLPCDKRRGFQGIFEAWATIALGKFLHLHHVFLKNPYNNFFLEHREYWPSRRVIF